MTIGMIWKRLSSQVGLMVGSIVYLIFGDSASEYLGDWAPVALFCCVYVLFWSIGWAGYFLQDRLRSKSNRASAKLTSVRANEGTWNARTVTKLAIAVSAQAAFAAAFGYWRGSVSDGMLVFIAGIVSIRIYADQRNASTSFQFSLRMLFWWTAVVAICVVVLTSLPQALPHEWRVFVSILAIFVAISLTKLIWKFRFGVKAYDPKWHRLDSRGVAFLGVITSPWRIRDERDERIECGPSCAAEV